MMASSSSCTLPPISDLFAFPRSSNASAPDVHSTTNVSNSANYGLIDNSDASNNCRYSNFDKTSSNNKLSGHYPSVKAKRKRASPSQLSVLNQVFSQTYFPSTELRIELGKHLGMSPRTVQIWFQNKRQSLRSRSRRYSCSSMDGGEIEVEEEAIYDTQRNQYDMARYPPSSSSPPCTPTSGSNLSGNDNDYFILPPPSSASGSSSPMLSSSSPKIKDDDYHRYPQSQQNVNLPPLRLHQSSYFPPSPPSSTYSSPISIDSILH